MIAPGVPGLHIICGPGVPTADYVCPRCWDRTVLRGRDNVKDGARDLPISHRAKCPALHQKGTT